MTEGLNASDAKSRYKSCRPITHRGYAFMALWTSTAIFISILSGYQIISFIDQVKLEEKAKYQMEDPYISSTNKSHQEASGNEHRNSTDVHVGIYLDHIKEFNIKDFKWTADFSIWFTWQDKNSTIEQKEKPFQVINADVDKDDIELVKRYCKAGSCYYRYEVKKASITENFDPRLYPLDNQYITIKIEPIYDEINRLVYVPDKNNSTISDRVNLTGLEIINSSGTVSTDTYRTNLGDPAKNISNNQIYSQYDFIISVERSNKVLLFFKLFQGLIVAVFVSMLALFIKPTWVDPRFGLGVGGLFAAVANNYIVSSALPVAGIVTLAGLVHGIGITIIFFTIAQSVLSLYIYDNLDARPFSELFDRVSFVLFASIFIITIATVIWTGVRV
jgi:hypothetical protein